MAPKKSDLFFFFFYLSGLGRYRNNMVPIEMLYKTSF